MILADTSVWIDHLRRGNARLGTLLSDGQVASHPFVLGELACGNLVNRAEVLSLLGRLPSAGVSRHGEVLTMVDAHRLMGRGLGWVDVHLLASALLYGLGLWTLDRRLGAAAEGLRVRSSP